MVLCERVYPHKRDKPIISQLNFLRERHRRNNSFKKDPNVDRQKYGNLLVTGFSLIIINDKISVKL